MSEGDDGKPNVVPFDARGRAKKGGRTKSTRPKGNGPGQGAGWGGPARGASDKVVRGPDALTAGPPTDPERATAQDRRKLKEERVAVLEDTLFELATTGEAMTRINAATRLHAIYEGQPVARQITHTVDEVAKLSDDDIRSELARLSREALDAGQGDAPPKLPGEPTDVVH